MWQNLIGCAWRTIRRFLDNECSLRAAGLTYYALMAVIPILCCIFSIAKVCHVDTFAREQINQRIDRFLNEVESSDPKGIPFLSDPDPETAKERRIAAKTFAVQARSASNAVFARVERSSLQSLGWAGLGVLLWTVVMSLAKVETSFNCIWGVTVPRTWPRRVVLYVFLMVILPVLSALAMSLPILNMAKNVIVMTLGATWLTKWVSTGLICLLEWTVFRFVVSLIVTSLAFGFFYWVLPNRRIRFRSAFVGGGLTAVACLGWMKVCTVAQVGIAKSSALYGSFAVIPIVLMWLFISWQIILFGACLTRMAEEMKGVRSI